MKTGPGEKGAGVGRRPEKPLAAAVVALGAVSLIAQVLLLRELMVAWRGNEMSFGIALAIWLTAGGVGSASYGVVSSRLAPTRGSLAAVLAAMGVIAPLSLLFSRFLPGALGLSFGEITGFAPLIAASLLTLAPLTLINGFAFALATSVVDRRSARSGAAGTVYLLEAAGAAAGGLAASFVILPLANPVAGMLFAGAVALASAACLLEPRDNARPRWRTPGRSVCAALASIAALVALSPLAAWIDDASIARQWREAGFVSQTNSIHGRIVATRAGSQLSLFENGVLSASVPDRASAEEVVHLPMLAHPDPRRVLLLGGGLGGGVSEVLKYRTVERVDYVELDPELIREAERAFGSAMTGGFEDPRVTVHFSDARFFVKRAAPSTYDVVILGAPEPTTARLNRLYTAEFMSEVSRTLTDTGVFGLTVRSAEDYIGTELAAFLASICATARTAFPEVTAYPGDPCHVIGSVSATAPTRDPIVLSERIEERELDVLYVRDYYLMDRLSDERAAALDDALSSEAGLVNHDLFPVTYYLSMVLWNRQFSGAPGLLPAARRAVNARGVAALSVALVLSLTLPLLRPRGRDAAARRAVFAAVVVVGATEISLELTALLAFQSIYGYVYHQLAILIAAFMAGLALGGRLGIWLVGRGAGRRTFVLLQLLIACVPAALLRTLVTVAALPAGQLDAWGALFPLVVVGTAVLAGAQFPVASALVRAGEAGATGGRLYGSDMLGAAVGATATSVILLPLLGVAGTMLTFTALNIAVLLSLAAALIPGRTGLPR